MSVEIVDRLQSLEDIQDDVEKINDHSFSAVPTSEEEVYDIPDKKLKDISWTNVNFRVKNKVILNECWGEVRILKYSLILV